MFFPPVAAFSKVYNPMKLYLKACAFMFRGTLSKVCNKIATISFARLGKSKF